MRTLLLSLAAAGPCVALELVRRDLAVSIEALPAAFDYTLSTPSGDFTGSDEFDRAFGLRLGGRWSFSSPGARGAAVAGLDLRLGDATYQSGGTYRTLGAGLSLGYARSLGRQWTIYGEPLIEYGWATLDFDATAQAPAITADGEHLLYGLRAGALYALSPRWLLEGSIGYVDISSDTESDGRAFDVEQQGLIIGLGVVWRFSGAPARLE